MYDGWNKIATISRDVRQDKNLKNYFIYLLHFAKKVSKITPFNKRRKNMFWTIIVLIVGVALFLFGGMFVKQDGKKPTTASIIVKKIIKLIAIFLIAGCVCRLYTPIYLTHTNPGILQEMVTAMQEQQNAEKNKAIRSYVRLADIGLWVYVKEVQTNEIFFKRGRGVS